MTDEVEGEWSGVVRCDRFVPLGDVLLLEAGTRRELARRRVHLPFFLELESGALLAVEPSGARVSEAQTTEGSWASLSERVGACLLDVGKVDGELELEERLVCAGDVVTVLGELHRGAPRGERGYRGVSDRPAAIRAVAVRVERATQRTGARLTDGERVRSAVQQADAEPVTPGLASVAGDVLDVVEGAASRIGAALLDTDWD